MHSPAKSSRPKILLVIDMQTGFNASYHEETQTAVRQLVETAARENCLVLIIEFGLKQENNVCGKTHAFILAPLAERECPQDWDIVGKAWTDGSAEICKYLQQRGIADATFVVCGTSTHGCVQETVIGLSARLPDSTFAVCKEACWQDFGNDWARFPSANNVLLIDDTAQCFLV